MERRKANKEHLTIMNEDQANKLGAFLRQARHSKGLSTRQLSRQTGVDQSLVVRIEGGQLKNPRANTLAAMATALELSVSDVYALADYLPPTELPSFMPYLRAKYGELPAEAVEQLERSFTRLARRYGYSPTGPAPGEDET